MDLINLMRDARSSSLAKHVRRESVLNVAVTDS